MTKISETSKRDVPRLLKLVLFLTLATGFGVVVAAIGWSWYPSVPPVLRAVTPAAFCLTALLIWRPKKREIVHDGEIKESK